MKRAPLYIECLIDAPMEKLWQHTQNPEKHQQWDLRFSRIDYLPKASDQVAQQFHYRTNIGFGKTISGKGESTAYKTAKSGSRISALKFWSNEPLSLIQTGSGYWKYVPVAGGIRFLTKYDYQTRFGSVGQWIDRILFRPLMGWATAWSFDCLRIWLEDGIRPALSIRNTAIHWMVRYVVAVIWIYQGLVPKLLFPDNGELALLTSAASSIGLAEVILPVVGTLQIVFGCGFLIAQSVRRLYQVQIGLMIFLGIAALIAQPILFTHPFNPLSLNLAMAGLAGVGLLTLENLISAKKCLRLAPKQAEQAVSYHTAYE